MRSSRCWLLALFWVPVATPVKAAISPTFTHDVVPILQAHCQTCHRPGEAGPFSMLTYEETRPWAAAMKEAVLRHKMPPWFADPHYGTFSNANELKQSEIDTIAAWADAKAPQGDPKDMPKPSHALAAAKIFCTSLCTRPAISNDLEPSQLQLALAKLVHTRETDSAAQGHENRMRRSLTTHQTIPVMPIRRRK